MFLKKLDLKMLNMRFLDILVIGAILQTNSFSTPKNIYNRIKESPIVLVALCKKSQLRFVSDSVINEEVGFMLKTWRGGLSNHHPTTYL